MSNKVIFIVLCSIFSQVLLAEELDWEITFQEAIYHEEVIGDLSKAMQIYSSLCQQNVHRELNAKIILRMAFCHEKMGAFDKAEELYRSILTQYLDMPAMIQVANAQVREYSKRQQIQQLQLQLKKLQEFSPALRTRLEKEIQQLQERIDFLQKQKTESSNVLVHHDASGNKLNLEKPQPQPASENKNNTSSSVQNTQSAETTRPSVSPPPVKDNKLNVTGEVSYALSSYLYKIARDLYQQSLFEMAKENLIKALSLNPQNEEAKELLKKVEIILSNRNAPLLIKEDIDRYPQNSTKSELPPELASWPSLSKEELQPIEKSYDAKPLMAMWELPVAKDNSSLWIANITRLIMAQVPTAKVRYEDAKFWVSDKLSQHEKLGSLWQHLLQSKEIVRISGMVAGLPEIGGKPFWYQCEGIFHSSSAGIFYTLLTVQQKEKVEEVFQRSIICNFPGILLIPGNEVLWEYFQKIPLIKGFSQNTPHFKLYSQGLNIVTSKIAKSSEIRIHIAAKKLHFPTDIIPTSQGGLEDTYISEQVSELQVKAEFPQYILVGGILNPYVSATKPSKDKLVLLFQLENIPIGKFLLEPAKQNQIAQPLREGYSVSCHDISPWQSTEEVAFLNYPDSLGSKDTEHFIISLLHQKLTIRELPTNALRVAHHQLVVYGPTNLHAEVEKVLAGLRAEAQSLCQISVYLLSLEKNSFQQLLQNWQIKPISGDSLQVYYIPLTDEKLLEQLRSLENVKFHYSLGPLVVGNTQSAVLKDCQMLSFVESIQSQGDMLQSKIVDIPEGLYVNMRPIILSPQHGMLKFRGTIYQRKDTRNIISPLGNDKKLTWKIPEVLIHRVNAFIPVQQGQSLILAGFQYERASLTREVIFMITPTIVKVSKDPVSPSGTTTSDEKKVKE